MSVRTAPQKWSMLGTLGWEVSLKLKDGYGMPLPVIAWAWSTTGEVRTVVCTRSGPLMLTKSEQAKAEFRQVRIQ